MGDAAKKSPAKKSPAKKDAAKKDATKKSAAKKDAAKTDAAKKDAKKTSKSKEVVMNSDEAEDEILAAINALDDTPADVLVEEYAEEVTLGTDAGASSRAKEFAESMLSI